MDEKKQAAGHRGFKRHRRLRAIWGIPLALIAASVLAAPFMTGSPGRTSDAGHVFGSSAARGDAVVPTPVASDDTEEPAGTTVRAAAEVRSSAKAAPPKAAPRAASGGAPLAGLIKPKVKYKGVATHYDAADGNGACLFGPSKSLMVVAMNHVDYETAKACGAYIRVRASNGRSVTVRVTNECPLPCARGQLDLSKQAFAKLDDLRRGRISVTWELLSPKLSNTISMRYKAGSSRWWCGIQAIGHRNPIARLKVNTAAGWRGLRRTGYNYFLSEKGAGCGGTIKITDIYGQELTIRGIKLRPDVAQPTKLQFARH